MKTSILYFSRTGETKAKAIQLGKKLNTETFQLTDNKNWNGPIGLLKGLWFSAINKSTTLEFDKKALDCDTLIIMSPLWLSGPSPAVKTFLNSVDHSNIYLLMMNHASPLDKVLTKYQTWYGSIIKTYGITVKKDNADQVIAQLAADLKA